MSDLQKIDNNQNNEISKFKNDLLLAKEMVSFVKESSYGKLFSKRVPDPNNPDKEIIEVSDEDIIANFFMSKALGLEPIVGITFGKQLGKLSYFQVMQGKELGMTPVQALKEIYAYEDKDGKIVTGASVHAKTKKLIDANVKFKMIVDFQPKKYYRYLNKMFIGYEYDKDIYDVCNLSGGIDAKSIKAIETANKIPITQHTDYYSIIEFTREGWQPMEFTYSLLDATDAGLYKGVTRDGNDEKGKANWNNHPQRILNGRIRSIASDTLAADQGQIYSIDEVKELQSEQSEQDITLDTSHEVVI